MITETEYLKIMSDIPGMMKGLKETIEEKKIPPENVQCGVAENQQTKESVICVFDAVKNDGTFFSYEESKDYTIYAKHFIADLLNNLFKELRKDTAANN